MEVGEEFVYGLQATARGERCIKDTNFIMDIFTAWTRDLIFRDIYLVLRDDSDRYIHESVITNAGSYRVYKQRRGVVSIYLNIMDVMKKNANRKHC